MHDRRVRIRIQGSRKRISKKLYFHCRKGHAINSQDFEGVLVLGVVSMPKETGSIRAALDLMDKHISILAQLGVGSVENDILVPIENFLYIVVDDAAVGARDVA